MLATLCEFPFIGFARPSAACEEFATEEQAAAFKQASQRFAQELRTSGGVDFERPDQQLIGALNCDRAEAARQKDLDEKFHTPRGEMTRREFLAGKFASQPHQTVIVAGPMSAEALEFSRARCKADAASIRGYLESRNKLLTAHIEGAAV